MNRTVRTVITFVAAACLLAVGLAAGYKMSQIKTEIAEVVTVSTTETTTKKITEEENTKTDFFGEVVDEYESSEGVVTLESEEKSEEDTTEEATTAPSTTKPAATTTAKPTQASTTTAKATTEAQPETTRQNYFVSFDKNGGSGTFHRLSGEPSYVLPKSVPERKGYTFKGWHSDTDGKIYQPGEKITPVDRTTLTAIWEAK